MGSTSGSIDQGALPGVLRDIYVNRRSGTLRLSCGEQQHRLHFHQGQLIDVGGPAADTWLASAVVERGLTDADAIAKALELARDRDLSLGRVLSEESIVAGDGLDAERVSQARSVLQEAAKWAEGRFAFEIDETTIPGAHAMHGAPTGDLIVDTVRAIDDPDVVRFALGDLDRLLAPSTDPLLRYQKVRLSPTEGFIMSRVDGILSAQEVAQLVPASPEETLLSLCALHSAGLVDFLDVTARATGARAATTDASRGGGAERRPPVPSTGAAPPAGAPAPAHRPVARPPSPPPPPRAAQGEPVREPPPPPTPAASRPAPPVASPPRGAPTTAPEPRKPPAPTPPPEAAVNVPLGATPLPTTGPDQEARRRQIEELYADLKAKSHFEILGLERTATDAQVKEAYFSLARRFHPDVLRGAAYADLRDKVEAVFIRLGQAYEILRSRDRRGRYESTLPKLAPTTPAASDGSTPVAVVVPPSAADLEVEARLAADGIRQAEKLLEKEKYWDAIQLAEGHLERAAPAFRSRARMVLAKCYLKNPNWAKRAEEMLLTLVEEEPKRAEAHFLLGTIYRDKGMRSRALSRLRKVLELKPDHEEAQALVLELEPPPDPDAAPESKGLVKRLFGRGGS